jgi:Flp pilus assembly protein TadG
MKGLNGERGQSVVLFSLLVVLFLLFVAMVVDVGFLVMEKRKTQNALDAAALAGAQELPQDSAAAQDKALEYAVANGLDADELSIAFECTSQISLICNASAGTYDTIVIEATSKAPVFFGGILGMVGDPGCWTDGCDVSALAAACSGGCGSSTVEVDVVAVVDHTGSMSLTELANAKDGAKAMYKTFDAQIHDVALAVTPPVDPADYCDTIRRWDDPQTWLPVGLTSDYQTSANQIDDFSNLVSTTACLDRASGSGDVPGPHTNLGEPMKAAMDELLNNGRPNATKGIVFLSDGAANIVDSASAAAVGAQGPCDYAAKMADLAKSNGIEIYTIAYGADDICDRDDLASPWYNKSATELLEAMATDSDHYYYEPKSSDLDPVFQTIGIQLGGSTRLIK